MSDKSHDAIQAAIAKAFEGHTRATARRLGLYVTHTWNGYFIELRNADSAELTKVAKAKTQAEMMTAAAQALQAIAAQRRKLERTPRRRPAMDRSRPQNTRARRAS